MTENKKCQLRKLTASPKAITYWKCEDCGTERKDIEIIYPIVCVCGRTELADGRVTHIRKIGSNSKYIRLPDSSTEGFFHNAPMSPEDTVEMYRQLKVNKGRKSWKMLHSFEKGDPRVFYKLWKTTIPKDCKCRKDFEKLEKQYPPNFSSPEKFWDWGWGFHNVINNNLTEEGYPHPQIPYDEAVRLWKSKYAFWQPFYYGGMETWTLALNKYLPSFGLMRKNNFKSPDNALEAQLHKSLKEVTIQDLLYYEKPVITSFIENFDFIKLPDIICVGHGVCDYTRRWIKNAKDVARSFVGVSEEVSKLIEEVTGKPCKTIENGIDTDRLIPSSSREELRRLHGIPEDAYVVGYTGRTTSEKNLDVLIEAISYIPNAYLLVSGWESDIDLQGMSNKVGIANRFKFIPGMYNVGDALAMMDTYVSCSSNEGFGLSTIEAMMFGLPIACSNVGIVEILTKQYGNIGIQTFKPGVSPYLVAKAIERASPCTIDLSKYTGQAMAKRWSDFLEERVNG